MFFSRNDYIGWVIAVIIVAIMGFIALHGNFGLVRPTLAQRANLPVEQVKILTFPPTIGRYGPALVTAKIGQQVTFTNLSNADHTVTARNYSFNSGNIGREASWTFTATKPGAYPYYCMYHPGMVGVIVVK